MVTQRSHIDNLPQHHKIYPSDLTIDDRQILFHCNAVFLHLPITIPTIMRSHDFINLPLNNSPISSSCHSNPSQPPANIEMLYP